MAPYSKILKGSDVSTRLAVKSHWNNDLFPGFEAGQDRRVLVVEDENGKNWEFSLRILRQKHNRFYISQATWRPFVVDKHAEIGDEVEFSKKTDGASGLAIRYKIRLIKKEEKEVMENEGKEVKLFGAIVDNN